VTTNMIIGCEIWFGLKKCDDNGWWTPNIWCDVIGAWLMILSIDGCLHASWIQYEWISSIIWSKHA
jgi:hypothetical protein